MEGVVREEGDLAEEGVHQGVELSWGEVVKAVEMEAGGVMGVVGL